MSFNLYRRHLVKGLLYGLASPYIISKLPIAQAAIANKPKQLSFNNLHTGEKLKITYWANGQYIKEALTAANYILRDFRTNQIYPIDLNLLELLNDLQKKLDTTQNFEIISGYRSPQTNIMLHKNSKGVASKSLHMQGKAIDIFVPGRTLKQIQFAALDLRRGGVGYYPRSNFVHVDTGRVRNW
ncbi:MAG: DUF882 domain-containing protein [Alphaproteobacteria bacterium]|nr:DUF882 domain-containing protein [Alphaproteobacteria bacterium]